MKSNLKITGKIILSNVRADGTVLVRTLDNLIVTYGLVGFATIIAGGAAFPPMTHLALGDSSTAATLGDISLGSELRRDAAVIIQLPAPQDNQVHFQVAFVKGAVVGSFFEAGLFDQATLGGNMFNRIVFAELVVGIADTLTVTWLIEIRNT